MIRLKHFMSLYMELATKTDPLLQQLCIGRMWSYKGNITVLYLELDTILCWKAIRQCVSELLL